MSELTRREFNSGLAAGLLGAAAGRPSAARVPNVLVIQTDQQRWDALNCAGNDQIRTPNLDRLAAEGTRFSRCVSSSPVCGPFRGTFQTGLQPFGHGVFVNGVPMRLTVPSFSQIFANRGYATSYVGKWHLSGKTSAPKRYGFVPPEYRFGWQDWHGYETGHSYFRVWAVDRNGNRVRLRGYDWEPTMQTEVALGFIKRQTRERQPWLCQVSYGPPHEPEECPEEFLEQYAPDAFRLTPDLANRLSPEREVRLRRRMRAYYGQVTAVDHEVGRLIEGLSGLGVDRDTIVFFTSDHGDVLGSHCGRDRGKLRWKNAPYANAFRIPLIVRAPGRVRAGQVCDALVDSIDLAPTLLGLAGLSAPPEMPGLSQANWCTQGTGPTRRAIYLNGGAPWRAWRAGDGQGHWRGVWDGRWVYAPLGFKVLYDHEADPYELKNRFHAKSLAPERERLHTLMVALAKHYGDPEVSAVLGSRPKRSG